MLHPANESPYLQVGENVKGHTPSQWDSLLKNLGHWQGSFTRLSSQGDVQEDIPTLVSLEGLNNNQTIRQTIQYFSAPPDNAETAVEQEKVLEYSSLNRGILFFENGAFSQGSMQLGPFSEFGAELGLINGDRRLRLVQLFDRQGGLARITLIREKRVGKDAAERPPLTLEALLGEWRGEAITLYPLQSPTISATTLSLQRQGEQLLQRLTTNTGATPTLDFSSTAKIDGSILHFNEGEHPVQVLLLPDGASCTSPLVVQARRPLFLEVGWLIQADLRQRMIRSYDSKGGWVSLTLITEHKIS